MGFEKSLLIIAELVYRFVRGEAFGAALISMPVARNHNTGEKA
jgi:hypothetical protein